MKSVSGGTHEANRIDELIVDGLPYKDNDSQNSSGTNK